ncbi:phage tail tape measure protein [Glutamicibacter protophormiae]|uniref:phage tail tape measure protein n=1 Tax=Glutamicibacter protophormiae TaxID=37930 RepID=UPI001957EC2E|nr:phage tail tape measure protein [Glutamicibacter protophormiae]QRQ79180.1 phage tail tape measure protein [Glutamicibacter protophormiae]
MTRTVKLEVTADVKGLVAGARTGAKALNDLAAGAKRYGPVMDTEAKKAHAAFLSTGKAAHRAANQQGYLYDSTGKLTDAFGRTVSKTQAAKLGLKEVSDQARYASEHADKLAESWQTVGQGMTVAGGLMVAGTGLAVKKFADFDKQMSSVQAATHETEQNMGLLRQAAIDAGADTAFSAVEAAQGIEELAKAGVSVTDVLNGGLNGALSLAAAGELEVGKAAEIASSAMTQFKLSGDQIPHLADLLAAGAGKAQGGVEDLGMALNQSGLVAASTGLTIEETVGGLTAFASAGLLGSDAGTSFKTMLQRLTPQSKEAQKQFDALGISAYDANGEFVGLADFAGQLQTKMAGLTPEARNAAMGIMFGSDAVRASTVLFEQGAEGVQKWIDQVNDAGYAADTAAIMQNNLAGDLEKLGGAFDTVFIQSGGAANDALRGLVQTAESVVDAIGRIPAPILGAGAVIGGLAGTAALVGGGLITVLPKIRDTRDALNDLFPAGSKAEAGLSKAKSGMASLAKGATVAAGILAVGVGIGKLAEMSYTGNIIEGTGHVADGLQDIISRGPEAATALDQMFKGRDGEGLTQSIQGIDDAIYELFSDGAGQKFDRWGQGIVNSMTGIKGTVKIAEEAFGGIDAELANLVNSGNADGAAQAMNAIQEKLQSAGVEAEESAYLFPQYADALNRVEAESKVAAAGSDVLAGALGGVGAEAEEVAASLDDILASLFELGRETRTTIEAEDALTTSLSALNKSVGENGKKFEGNSKAAMENREALIGVAADMESLIDAQARGGASAGEIQSTMQTTYDAMMKATGGSEELVRSLLSIPPGVNVKTWMEETAREIAEGTADAIEAIPGYKKVGIAVSEDGTAGQVQSRINEVTGKTEYIFVTEDGTVAQVQAGIASINGKDVPVYVGDDGTVYSTQGKIDGIKGKDVTIFADAETRDAISKLDAAARDRYSTIHTRVVTTKETHETTGPGGRGGITRASGGSVFGPGTETSDSIPAWLSTNEHVLSAREVRGLGGHGSVERLRAMARNGQAPAFATGGAVGRAEKKVERLQRQYSRMPGDKKNRNRKLDLKDELDAAKKELKAVKASTKASEKAAKEAKKKAEEARKAERERQGRLSEARFDLRRDLKRGDITDSFTSGSGMSVVDRLFEQSFNKDLSKTQRGRLRSLAYKTESELLRLEKQSDKLASSLDKATNKRDELLSVKNNVASTVRGGFSLQDSLDTVNASSFKKTTAKSLLGSVQARAGQMKAFGVKVEKLRKKGYSAAIIEEVVSYGIDGGTELADILLSATGAEKNAFNSAYKSMDKYAADAGESVTNAMYKGGIDAAEGLVKGLESQQKKVDGAFYKLGKSAEGAFKKSLGIKSPSRVMKAAGINVGEGAELGILSKVGDVQSAAEKLMSPPALTVPPSYEVSRYAQAQQPRTTENHYHIDAKPGLAYEYAKDVANQTSTRVGDKMAAYGIN